MDITPSTPRAAYVHVPFCRHRCGYCNFTLVAGRDDLIERYLAAIDIELSRLEQPCPVDTLFFGGGTPTHLSVPQLKKLFDLVQRWFPLRKNAEVSVEANPTDLVADKVDALADVGVNRISLGVQSWQSRKLEVLERDHRRADVQRALETARRSIRSVSIDLIFGVPGESRDDWQRDLDATLAAQPDHVSTYGLTYERGAKFFGRQQRGELSEVSEEDEAWMYEYAIDVLQSYGWDHYEVSNFARRGHRCRHNETYWLGDAYHAIGPGASRFIDGRRETNHRSTTTYINRVLAGKSPVAERECLSTHELARERFVFGMRRLDGVDLRQWQDATKLDPEQVLQPALAECLAAELFRQVNNRVQLTRRGLLISDSIWPLFLVGDPTERSG